MERCFTCKKFRPFTSWDKHSSCPRCRPCLETDRCDVCSAWTPSRWEALQAWSEEKLSDQLLRRQRAALVKAGQSSSAAGKLPLKTGVNPKKKRTSPTSSSQGPAQGIDGFEGSMRERERKLGRGAERERKLGRGAEREKKLDREVGASRILPGKGAVASMEREKKLGREAGAKGILLGKGAVASIESEKKLGKGAGAVESLEKLGKEAGAEKEAKAGSRAGTDFVAGEPGQKSRENGKLGKTTAEKLGSRAELTVEANEEQRFFNETDEETGYQEPEVESPLTNDLSDLEDIVLSVSDAERAQAAQRTLDNYEARDNIFGSSLDSFAGLK